MPTWFRITIICAAVGLSVFFWLAKSEKESIKQDVEQARAALLKAKSYHFHYDGPNYLAGKPPLTRDVWVVCPNYRYDIIREQGGPDRQEIRFDGLYFAKTSDKWVKVPEGSQSKGMQGCDNLTSEYGLGIPAGFDLMLNHGEIHVDNHQRTVGGETCYDYTATIPLADVAERKLSQKLCLNSDDHLPREVSFHGWGADRDSVYTYDQWNKTDRPNFPEGFNPALF